MTQRIYEINKAESEHQLAEVLLEERRLAEKKAQIISNLEEINRILKLMEIPDNEVEYLYGCKAEEFIQLPHPDALAYKLKKSKELHAVLYYAKLPGYDQEVRLFKVTKAIKHTEARVSELSQVYQTTKRVSTK